MAIGANIKSLGKNDFVRSASALVGGTAAAQALTILALPILTRLYTPDDFALLAVYIAILSMVQVIVCLRLEIAIPLPEEDDLAANLLALSIGFALTLSVMAALFLWLAGDWFFAIINQPSMQPYAWLLPIGLVFAGLYSAAQYWSTRKGQFPTIAWTRMTQSLSGLTAQLGMGWFGFGALGLLVGHAIMSGAGVFKLAWSAWVKDPGFMRSITIDGMREALWAYRRFPFYSTWEALANNAALQVPVLLIAALALGPEAGFLLLASRAIGTPVTMLGNAVSQVYLSKAPAHLRAGTLWAFTRKIMMGIAAVSFLPLLTLSFAAPWIVNVVFGPEWNRTAVLIVWMTPWFLLKLVASSVSMVMHITMRQRQMLLLMVAGLVLRVGAVLVAVLVAPDLMSEVYAVSGAVFYAVALVLYALAARAKSSLLP